MKKIVLTFVAIFMAVAGMAQLPSVSINYDTIKATSIETSYAKNDVCDSFYYMSGTVGEFDQWLPLMGSLENLIKSWGIHTSDSVAIKVWNDLIPNTEYVFYTLAVSADTNIVETDTVSTAVLGGEGLSTVAIDVKLLSNTSARVVNTPNDQTAAYKSFLIEAATFTEIGQDSVITLLKEDPYTQYEVYDWVWAGLVEHTEYYAVAIGKNVNGEWGEFAIDTFRTDAASIEIVYDSIGARKIKTSYNKNQYCDSYYIFSGSVGEVDQWIPMMGSLENVIKSWGIKCNSDTTKMWTGLTPNTDYVFYTLAVGSEGEILQSDTVKTIALGGEGVSTIAISVTEMTDSTARVICTPNDQTASFHTIVLTAAMFEEWGQDSVMNYVKQDPYPQYEVDDHVWFDLLANTAYKAVAIGVNINDEWGELAVVDFMTAGANGINDVVESKVTVYPNPTTNYVKVSNITEGSIVTMYDLQGRAMMQTKANGNEITLDMSTMTAGMYIMQVSNDGVVERGVRIIKK